MSITDGEANSHSSPLVAKRQNDSCELHKTMLFIFMSQVSIRESWFALPPIIQSLWTPSLRNGHLWHSLVAHRCHCAKKMVYSCCRITKCVTSIELTFLQYTECRLHNSVHLEKGRVCKNGYLFHLNEHQALKEHRLTINRHPVLSISASEAPTPPPPPKKRKKRRFSRSHWP